MTLLCVGLLIASVSAAIQWDASDVEEALELAAHREAPALVLFVDQQSPSCERLLRDLAATYLAELPQRLVLSRIEAETGEGAKTAHRWGVLDLPTAIVFAPAGDEIDRVCGYADPEAWHLAILRAAQGTDPLPALLNRAREHDLHAFYEAGWRLLVRGEQKRGRELLRRVYSTDSDNAYGHTLPALRLLARYWEQIDERPETALTYWKILLDKRFDPQSRAEALSALVRIYPAIGKPEDGLHYLTKQTRKRLDDRNRLEDLTAFAERTGVGTLETATMLRDALRLNPHDRTAELLIRLLLSEGRIWEAEEQIQIWRKSGWEGPGMDALAARVLRESRRAQEAWDTHFDTPPQLAERVDPECPESATLIGASGQLVVEVMVGPDGSVLDCEIRDSSGVDALDGAALEAIAQWTFRPAKKGGKPVAAHVLVPLNFDCR
jgi:TonB family protein